MLNRHAYADSSKAAFDPVTLEIVKNALDSIADEMALVVLRSAYSPIVRDSMDYSTAVCDHEGRVIAQGLTNPVHLGSFPSVMAHVRELFGEDIEPGDSFIVNDPYLAGGMHLPDIYMIKPIFAEGEIQGYAATLVHHTDVGGLAPGSMALHATEVFQEGLRIPLLKFHMAGRLNEALPELLKANSRMPDQLMGDLRAQIAACLAAERGFVKLIDKYGAAGLRAMTAELHDYAERLVRQRIAEMPDGVYEAEDFIDGLGASGKPLRFKLKVEIDGSDARFDWTGTSKQVQGAINGPVAITRSVTYAALRCAIGIAVPNCEGYSRPVTIEAPLGSLVNPRAPAACAARGVLAYRMLDVLFAALAQVVPDRIPAAGEGGPSAISLSGWHDDAQWLITDGVLGSWGGRAGKDGVDGIANPGANLSNQPVELIEARMPLRIGSYGLTTNSAGAGKHRGGMSIHRSYIVLGDAASLTVRSDRRRFLPQGVDGGFSGTPSLNILSRASGESVLLPVMPMETIVLGKGDEFIHIAAGAAGHGNPLLRDVGAVLADIANGRIDAMFAREIYGVVAAQDGQGADIEATAATRAALSQLPAEQRRKRQTELFLTADPLRGSFAERLMSEGENK